MVIHSVYTDHKLVGFSFLFGFLQLSFLHCSFFLPMKQQSHEALSCHDKLKVKEIMVINQNYSMTSF